MIPLFKVYMSEEAIKRSTEVLRSGYIGQGPVVDEFEDYLKTYLKNDKVLTLNSATSAEHLALHLLKKPSSNVTVMDGAGSSKNEWPGLEPGDEILATALTCLYHNSPILLADGTTSTIGKIVKKKLDAEVVSYNTKTQAFENKRITNWIKKPLGDSEWYYVTYSTAKPVRTNKTFGVYVTGDHEFLTTSGYKRADKLTKEDKILTNELKYNSKQLELINGILLGDGHLSKKIKSGRSRLSTTHTEKNLDYINLIYNSLNESLVKSIRASYKHTKKSYILESKKTAQLSELRDKWYPDTKKVVPPDIELTPLTLAAWYMDDGSFQHAPTLCTDCFTPEDTSVLLNKLIELGIHANLHKTRNTTRIYIPNFKKDSKEYLGYADKFFEIIAPYIVDSMQYKLPEKFRGRFNPELYNLGDMEVYTATPEVIKKDPAKKYSKEVYCIEVEDNHNFISQNLILKNCTASNFPIILGGYKIKWVDVDPLTLNMDLDDLARKISPKTKVIMLVFWGGMPVDMTKLEAIQARAQSMYGFKPAIIIDGAHSFGSTFNNKPINNFGHITTYSFQAIKHITSVDGGALVLPHSELYRRGKLLRWYGIDRNENRKEFRCESDVEEAGTKWHMNDVNAAIGLENLKASKNVLNAFIENAEYYNQELKNVSGVTLLTPTPGAKSAYWLFTMKVTNRDDFTVRLSEKGIVTSRVHERNDKHTATRPYISQLPTLDKVSKEMICIPVGWWVSREDREYIVKTIKEGW